MTTITVARIGDGRSLSTAYRPDLPGDVSYAVVREYPDRFAVRVSDSAAEREDVQAAIGRATQGEA